MIRFAKYQGTGNDFILVDNRNPQFQPDKELVLTLCHRRFGIGADGLILLEYSEDCDFKMVYYNADGMESSMCGNGGRCIAHFARSLGLCGDIGSFDAIDGRHDFQIGETGIVKLRMKDVFNIEHDDEYIVMDTGSPHYLIFTDNIMEIPLLSEARKIRYNQRFQEEGINVNFIEESKGEFFMRTYERGVEDETLSCGTGTVAVALSIALKEGIPDGSLEINTPGGKLSVHFKRIDEGFSDIWLEGPAEMVFQGTIPE